MKNIVFSLVAVLTLSGCQLIAVAGGEVESTIGGTEALDALSSEAAFYDAESGTVLVDASVAETRVATKRDLPGADPIAGSVEVLGQSGDVRAARWQETMNGVVENCSGWFNDSGAAWGCGSNPVEPGPPMVEYQVTCGESGASAVSVFSLDERVVALRVDGFNGASIVGIDPRGLGLVGVSAPGAVVQALAQTAEGQVFEIAGVEGAAICQLRN